MMTHWQRPALTLAALAVGLAACERPLPQEPTPDPPDFSHRFYTERSSTGMPYADLGNGRPIVGFIRVHALNSRGDLVGHEALVAPGQGAAKGWLWTRENGWIDLGSLGPGPTQAYALNKRREIVGVSNGRPFRWTTATGMIDLSTVGLPATAVPLGINKKGAIVGYWQLGPTTWHAFLWTSRRGLVDLGALAPDHADIGATAINDYGEIVGYSGIHFGVARAFRWTPETGMVDLGTLGGAQTAAFGINRCGEVVGYSRNATGAQRPFLWSEREGIVDLGTFGGADGVALGINSHGHVAGYARDAAGIRYAFVWSRATGLINLGAASVPGPPFNASLSLGYAINDRDQVAAVLRIPNPGIGTTGLFDVDDLGLSEDEDEDGDRCPERDD